jgi:hypothetical protein
MQLDGESYKASTPNPAIDDQQTDGGWWITRPKFTRAPSRSWKFKFTDISQADKDTLENFFRNTVKGSSVVFTWTDPSDNQVHSVRFGKGYNLEFTRTGYGPINRYDTNEMTLTEV